MTFLKEDVAFNRLPRLSAAGRAATWGETFAGQFRQYDFRGGVIRLEVRRGELPDPSMLAALGLEPATPFQGTAWLAAWQDAGDASGNAVPVTVIGYSGATPVFALPLAVTKRLGLRVLTWHSGRFNDYCAPLVGKGFAAAAAAFDGENLLSRVAEAVGGVDLVHLIKNPAQIAGVANPFITAGATPYHVRAHAVTLPAGSSFEDFYTARRSTKTRRRIKEKLIALQKTGAVEFCFAQTPDEARTIVRTCLDAKSRQLRENGHWDLFADPDLRDSAVSYFAENAAGATWACSLTAGGEVLASAVGFRDEKRWLLYQMSMTDSDRKRFSPGTHLLMHILKHCIEARAEELDLALGDESYKAEWCDVTRGLMVTSVAITPWGSAAERIIKARAAILRRVSGHPGLRACGKRLQYFARKLRLPV